MANGEVGGVDFLTHPGTTNDEEFAFNLQKEEIKLAAESSKRKQEQEMRVKQREREREREREIRAVQQQHHLNTKPRTERVLARSQLNDDDVIIIDDDEDEQDTTGHNQIKIYPPATSTTNGGSASARFTRFNPSTSTSATPTSNSTSTLLNSNNTISKHLNIDTTKSYPYRKTDGSPLERTNQFTNHLNSYLRKNKKKEEMTKQDEQVARQLQEEFDKELALSIDHHQTLNDNSRDLNRNFRNNIHRNANNRNSNNTHVIRPIRDLADFSATSSDDTTREDTVTEAYPVLFHRLGDSGISIANSSRPDLPINLQTSRGQNLNSILERFTEEIHGRNQANSNRNNNRSRASNDHPFNNSNLSGFRSRNSINRLLMQSDNFDANDYDTLLRLDDFHSQKKTLTSQEFKSLPQFEYQRSSGNQDAQCSICMDDFENKVKITALTCSHKFHTKCIEEWLSKQSRVCPLCKKDAVNGK